MTDRAFQTFCAGLLFETKQRTPIDTGNMRYNAVRMYYTDGGKTCHILVDEYIAPYVFYTNEPWISPKWRGKKNPNEGWWDKCAEVINNRIQRRFRDSLAEVIIH